MTVPIVAIDTNSINMLRQDRYLNQLEEWHHAGLIEIKRSEVLGEELATNAGVRGEQRREKAQRYKEGRGTRAFTLRRSTLRGGDTLRGPSADQWIDPIREVLHPGRDFDALSERDQRDIAHLATCKLHGWDYFVTLDKHIFSHADELLYRLNIRVLNPAAAIREIEPIVGLK